MLPEFAVEDLPLGRTAALVPEFAVKDLPLGRKHYNENDYCYIITSYGSDSSENSFLYYWTIEY